MPRPLLHIALVCKSDPTAREEPFFLDASPKLARALARFPEQTGDFWGNRVSIREREFRGHVTRLFSKAQKVSQLRSAPQKSDWNGILATADVLIG